MHIHITVFSERCMEQKVCNQALDASMYCKLEQDNILPLQCPSPAMSVNK